MTDRHRRGMRHWRALCLLALAVMAQAPDAALAARRKLGWHAGAGAPFSLGRGSSSARGADADRPAARPVSTPAAAADREAPQHEAVPPPNSIVCLAGC